MERRGPDRVRRPHRLPGQAARPAHRARRDRIRPARPSRGPAGGRRRALRRDARRPPRRLPRHRRRTDRPHRTGRGRAPAAAGLHGAVAVRRDDRVPSQRVGQARAQGPARARLQFSGNRIPRTEHSHRGDGRRGLRERARRRASRRRRRLLRPGRQLAECDARRGTYQRRPQGPHRRAGVLRRPDRRAARHARRHGDGRRRLPPASAGAAGAAGAGAAVAGAAADVVPQPPRSRLGGQQHHGRTAAVRDARRRRAPGGRVGRGRAARGAAHRLPGDGGGRLPAGAAGLRRGTGPHAGEGDRVRDRVDGGGHRRGRVRRHDRGARSRPSAAGLGHRARAGARGAPHRSGRLLDGSAHAGRDGRLRRPYPARGTRLGAVGRAVRRLRHLAAAGPRFGGRSAVGRHAADRVLGAPSRRCARAAGPADRPAPARRRHQPCLGARLHRRRIGAPGSRPAGAGHPDDAVHGGARRPGGRPQPPVGLGGRHHRHADRRSR
ncbi:hypothetical protein AIIKEEIJ_02379 [Rhodococcus sp. YH1]|nr:hypothetical protein [Rhodococcus sp. YH1]